MRNLHMAVVLSFILLVFRGEIHAADDNEYMVGINLAGPEFAPGQIPGIEGRNYGWPSAQGLDYWKSKGIRLVRLPFLWERLQPKLMDDFAPEYWASLRDTVKRIGERQMVVILDVHNYGMYRGNKIGSAEVPNEAFADLWKQLAKEFNRNETVWGYGLMNEPTSKFDWAQAAQAAIDAIRSEDKETRIFVANDYAAWGATRAGEHGRSRIDYIKKTIRIPDPSVLKDPSDRLRFELHTYFDHDSSGTYRYSYDHEIARKDGPEVRVGPDTGIDRIRPFVEWLKKHHVKGFVGEYCSPANPDVDKRWLVTLDKTMRYMEENKLPSTFWAAGEFWSEGNPTVIDPRGWSRSLPDEERLQDRPQLEILRKYLESSPAVSRN